MVAPIVITVLAFLHIAAGMAWFGGLAFNVSVLSPGTKGMNPQSRLDFLANVVPKAIRFSTGAAIGTFVFGLGLFFAIPGLGNAIYGGVVLALLAFVLGMAVVLPSMSKAARLAKETMATGQSGPPPAELANAMKRAGMGSMVVLLLLALTIMFMVYSGFPF